MKKISIYIAIVAVLFGAISCEEKLDINSDPLASTLADPATIIPYTLVAYEARKQTELGTRILDVSQHVSACFNSPRAGITTSFLTGNTWFMYYNLVLGNLVLLEQDARAAGETRNNVTAFAVIMKALAFYELSVIYEQAPFTEALNGTDFPSPNFDSQETILKGTVDMLDEAVALIAAIPTEGAFQIGTEDFIYNGDMSLWERFANSLQLRILMLIRNADAGYAAPRITDVLSRPLISELGHVARFPFFNNVGNQHAYADLNNTFFGTENNEVVGVYAASPVLRDLLVDNNDPRLGIFLTDINGGDDYDAPPMGTFSFGAFGAVVSSNIIRYDLPAVWYTPAETAFYRAELALAGEVTGDADALTQEGVTLALQYYGGAIDGATATIAQADIDAFAATFVGVTQQQLHEQQYLETFMRPVVSWNHVRRTRVPELDAVPGAVIDDFFQRFSYPPDEIGANPNASAQAINNAEAMWAFPKD